MKERELSTAEAMEIHDCICELNLKPLRKEREDKCGELFYLLDDKQYRLIYDLNFDYFCDIAYEGDYGLIPSNEMKPIPISAAREIAEKYGYDQVVIIARRVGEEPNPRGEHVTTYGVNKEHCDVAARIGDHLKYNVMGWSRGT